MGYSLWCTRLISGSAPNETEIVQRISTNRQCPVTKQMPVEGFPLAAISKTWKADHPGRTICALFKSL